MEEKGTLHKSMTNYHLLAVQTKTYFHTHTIISNENYQHHRIIYMLGKKRNDKKEVRHILLKVESISLIVRIYMCLMFGHASLFDRHFRMAVRIVWKICRIPWTSVR